MNTISALFEADEIRRYLLALGEDLEERGNRAEIFLVGGAAIALAYDARRMTRDLDAVFEPKSVVYEAAERVAERFDLEPDWLNDAVKGFLPGTDADACTVLEAPGIHVAAGSPRYLLAMKVASARVDRDTDDIRFLAELCGYRTAAEVLATTEEIWGRMYALLPKSRFLVEEVFSQSDHDVFPGNSASYGSSQEYNGYYCSDNIDFGV
jgi:hypothetical protein